MCLNGDPCRYNDNNSGFSIELFASLINHSCVSNVAYINIDNKKVTIVTNPVKAGEQIFHCYYTKDVPDHEESRNIIMKLYGFVCDCQLCINNSHQYQPINIVGPFLYTRRKSLKFAEITLKTLWKFMNTKGTILKGHDTVIAQCLTILRILGYFATFPC